MQTVGHLPTKQVGLVRFTVRDFAPDRSSGSLVVWKKDTWEWNVWSQFASKSLNSFNQILKARPLSGFPHLHLNS